MWIALFLQSLHSVFHVQRHVFLGGGYGPGKCYLQGGEDITAYEKVGSVLALVGAIFVHLSWWHTIFIFGAAKKKRMLMLAKSSTSKEGVVG